MPEDDGRSPHLDSDGTIELGTWTSDGPPHWISSVHSEPLSETFSSHASTKRKFAPHIFARSQQLLTIVCIFGAVVLCGVNIVASSVKLFTQAISPTYPGWAAPTLLAGFVITSAILGCDTRKVTPSERRSRKSTYRNYARSKEATQTQNRHSFLDNVRQFSRDFPETLKPGGSRFSLKMLVLQLLKLHNMCNLLWRLMSTGQRRVWICLNVSLILVNGIVAPRLYCATHPRFHTIFLLLFDLFMDTLYGAVLPILLILPECIHSYHNYYEYLDEYKKVTTVTESQWRAVAVASCYVPHGEFYGLPQAFTLITPFCTYLLKLMDIKRARLKYHLRILDHAEPSRLKKVFSIVYMVVSFFPAILALIFLIINKHCRNVKGVTWGAGCLQQSWYTTQPCSCIYFRGMPDSNYTFDEMQAMLERSGPSLTLLDYRGYTHREFPSLDKNPNLVWLFLKHGNLEHFPDLSNQMKLERLKISKHKLLSVPYVGSRTLKWYDFSYNQLTTVPDFSCFPKLELLTLSGNKLDTFPKISELTRLRKVRLAYNKLHGKLPSFTNNNRLQELDVTGNLEIVSLPSGALHMNERLQRLLVAGNKLQTLPSLTRNTQLLWLDVANNQLSSLPDLDQLTKLWFLNASGNRLTHLPAFGSRNLTHVDVCKNPISEVKKDWPLVPMTGNEEDRICECCKKP